jgi:hypothetical protein
VSVEHTEPEAAPARAAVLVIHGIGEQSPYQAVDAFARGLATALNLGAGTLEHRIVRDEGRMQSMVRMHLPASIGRSRVSTLDLSEFYWAGMVQGRIGIWQVLAWLARTSLTPLRQWSRQAAVLFDAPDAWHARLWIFGRELFRSFLFVGIAALVVGPFAYAATRAREVRAAAMALWNNLRIERPLLLLIWLALVFVALMLLEGWRRSQRRRRLDPRVTDPAVLWWETASLRCSAALLVAAAVIEVRFKLGVFGLLATVWSAVAHSPVWPAAFATVLAFLLRPILVNVVGDIVLYVTADEKSSFFRTRTEILQAAQNRLRALLTDQGYGAVYVVGHSLGSVIGYDVINGVAREVRAGPPGAPGKLTQQHLDRLRGLLTFGSPLDKIYYFFRTEVGDQEAVRAQLLSSIHGFRRKSSRRDYGPLTFRKYRIPEPADFRWLNVYSVMDVVGGHLDFYDFRAPADVQLHRPYRSPHTAHLQYWHDPVFYQAVVGWL